MSEHEVTPNGTGAGQQGPPTEGRASAPTVLRPMVGFLANVTVLTALLVFFGWRRSETEAGALGIASSVLDMSTQDYLLRSVRPVLVLLIGLGVAGLAWVVLDRFLVGLIRSPRGYWAGGPQGRVKWLLRGLATGFIVLPALVWTMGFVWRPLAFVMFPASIGVGVLLLLYVAHLHQLGVPVDVATGHRNMALQVSGLLLAGVCLFWTAANYAQVEGVQLADDIANAIVQLPGVVIYSQGQLHLDGPGVTPQELSQVSGELRFRYSGLRLLEHTGGKYFLISDGWTRTYGVMGCSLSFAMTTKQCAST